MNLTNKSSVAVLKGVAEFIENAGILLPPASNALPAGWYVFLKHYSIEINRFASYISNKYPLSETHLITGNVESDKEMAVYKIIKMAEEFAEIVLANK